MLGVSPAQRTAFLGRRRRFITLGISKNMKINTYIPRCAVLISLLFVTACSPKPDDVATETASNPLETIQLLDTKPIDALAVKVAKARLKPGDEATVFGQIGGVGEPFLQGYAGFVLGDTDIVFCNELPGDNCDMPWDACCADQDDLKAYRASVNFIDAEGKIIPTSMKGFGGLAELHEVVVTGTVAMTSTPDNLIIEATGVYVQ